MYRLPPRKLVSPIWLAALVNVAQLVSTVEPSAEILPIVPGWPVPKYMSPTVQPFVLIFTVVSLISVLGSPIPCSVVQELTAPFVAMRAKLFVSPVGLLIATISELLEE